MSIQKSLSTSYSDTGNPPTVCNTTSAKVCCSKIQIISAAASQPDLKASAPTLNKNGNEKYQDTRKKVKKKKKPVLSANLTLTKYNLVKQVCSDYGFNISDHSSNECLLIWSDSAVPIEKIAEMKPYQKINHFAGMGEICRKDSLARNMWKVAKLCPEEFDFVPQSWVLPGEYAMFQFHARENKKKRTKTYIRKPVNGAMGHGIWLTRNIDKIHSSDCCIIQEYLDKPLLMDGYKFDLRLYVLVLSCDPLKIFLYKDGLVRMGTAPYVSPNEVNVSNSFMHLTNYSINKHSENFIQTSKTELGSKRTLKYFWKWLEDQNGNSTAVWNNIVDVVIKTILVAMPHLFHAYHMCRGGDPGSSSCCFEILGFDIFIDRKYKPWVLEVNRAPSFGTDQELDYEIKYGVLSTTMKLLNIKISDKRKIQKAEKMESQKRLIGSGSRKSVDTDAVGSRKKLLQKRKKELKWRLSQVRDEEKKKEFENKHCGDFVCIFPPSSSRVVEHYNSLLSLCTQAVTGRCSLRKEHSTLLKLKEEEILDLLQEVEDDVLHLVDDKGQLVPKGPTPLSSMPCSSSKRRAASAPTSERISSRPSSRLSLPSQVLSKQSSTRLKSVMSQKSGASSKLEAQPIDEERMEKSKDTLKMLTEMKIKFPGKTDEQAKKLLDQIQEDWKFHRPRVAAYWLVKLDAIKRRKVIDIVKGNVNVILKRAWQVSDVETLTLHRMFNKLFNRLLWSHGQGLWNCFNNSDSWESIFLKSSERFIQEELECCRQVVQLCRECLLVVYQFASESSLLSISSELNLSTSASSTSSTTVVPPLHKVYTSRSYHHQPDSCTKLETNTGGLMMGSKIAKLYK